MTWTIDDPEIEQLATELAALTGETTEVAIRVSLQEYWDRLRREAQGHRVHGATGSLHGRAPRVARAARGLNYLDLDDFLLIAQAVTGIDAGRLARLPRMTLVSCARGRAGKA